ncbi:hypothetical protein PR003_g26494 [Phytophthora rubi]|uniref:Uncharacterized protein n=1 Tax=Phytophthora rubi TaxID=129364 RepID=A0A6A4C5W8_9STRA|nr:hypothetical protein PR003_g26494 [Phytophthora rubi]
MQYLYPPQVDTCAIRYSRVCHHLEEGSAERSSFESPAHFTSPVQVRVASGEGGAWRLSLLPWEGPVLVRMQVEMQDVYNAAGSVRDERMS